jgi:hypothetical protein
MPKIPLSEGRRLFGNDPLAYANARPDYPEKTVSKAARLDQKRPFGLDQTSRVQDLSLSGFCDVEVEF